MANKNQGRALNRTLTVFLDPADFGAFNTATIAIILNNDSARKIRLTGFAFNWRVGAAADINANHFSQVSLIEGFSANPDSNISPLPDKNNSMSFSYGKAATQFMNDLDRRFDQPFILQEGVESSFIAQITLGAAIVGTVTARLTLFGYEGVERLRTESLYSNPR